MELRVLRYFLAVAREENITAAAKILNITQPTLSKQMMELENELGKKLFVRGNRKISLTEDGMFLLRRAQEIVDLTDKTEAEFHNSQEPVHGEVFIGCGETRAMRYVADAFRKLRGDYPGIRLYLYSGNGEDVSKRLEKGLLDFGLFVGLTDFKKYDYLKLPVTDTWGLLMRKDDPMASKGIITPDMLPQIPLLYSRQAMIQNELSGWMGRDVHSLNLVATYNLVYNASIMVEAGLGAALCIDGLINTTGDSPLRFCPFEPRLTADLVLAWKKSQVFSRAAEKFLEYFTAEEAKLSRT